MSVADTVRTGKRSLQFFRGGPKFKVYIGSPAFKVRSKTAYFSNLCLDFVEPFRMGAFYVPEISFIFTAGFGA